LHAPIASRARHKRIGALRVEEVEMSRRSERTQPHGVPGEVCLNGLHRHEFHEGERGR
jgi:hypothetical protein